MSAVNNYEKAYLPSRITAVRIANGYLQERIYHGSNQRIIFEHGIHVFNVAKLPRTSPAKPESSTPTLLMFSGFCTTLDELKTKPSPKFRTVLKATITCVKSVFPMPRRFALPIILSTRTLKPKTSPLMMKNLLPLPAVFSKSPLQRL